MEKRKIYGLIIGIIGFIILLVGASYALYKWANTEEQRTHVNLTITDDLKENIIYNPGTSILETDGQTLELGEDYTTGISATIEFWKTPETTRVINGSLYLKILNMLSKEDTTDANIKKSNTVKWAITTYNVNDPTEVLLSTGSFYGKSIGNTFAIKENVPLNPYQTFFKIYLWLDRSAIDVKYPVSGELLSTEISAKAVGTDEFEWRGDNAAQKIIDLASTDNCASNTSGVCPTNGYATDANGDTIYHEYRYRGANVDNYVWFNDDMYRIIGVFDNNSHGIEDSEGNGVYMLKLISANLLTSTTYGVYNSLDSSNTDTYLKEYAGYTNDFRITSTTHSNANILLNEYFNYNADTTYGACGNWTYYNNNTNSRTYDCSDILGYGIKDSNLKKYIETVKWYLYGYTGTGEDKEFFYTCERGGNSCTGPNGLTENVYLEDEIGLMYVSDYLYASGYVASDDTDTLAKSDNGNQNWLYKGREWTITPISNTATHSFNVNYSGNVSNIYAYSGNDLRPAFYLKSSILITGGEGTFDNPYTIST